MIIKNVDEQGNEIIDIDWTEYQRERIEEVYDSKGMLEYLISHCRKFTDDEIRERKQEERIALLEEQVKVLNQMLLQKADFTDEESLKVKLLYPAWEEVIGQSVAQGFKFLYKDELYKVIQPSLTIEAQYVPNNGTESLYARIDEVHKGTLEDPIPYNGNMELYNSKYYTQDNVLYKCMRDTGTPVYHALSDLVGIYVEVTE